MKLTGLSPLLSYLYMTNRFYQRMLAEGCRFLILTNRNWCWS